VTKTSRDQGRDLKGYGSCNSGTVYEFFLLRLYGLKAPKGRDPVNLYMPIFHLPNCWINPNKILCERKILGVT